MVLMRKNYLDFQISARLCGRKFAVHYERSEGARQTAANRSFRSNRWLASAPYSNCENDTNDSLS